MGIHSPKALVASWELNPHCLMGLMAIEHRTTLMRTVFKTPAEVGSPWCFFLKMTVSGLERNLAEDVVVPQKPLTPQLLAS